jgi:hypothetical protein
MIKKENLKNKNKPILYADEKSFFIEYQNGNQRDLGELLKEIGHHFCLNHLQIEKLLQLTSNVYSKTDEKSISVNGRWPDVESPLTFKLRAEKENDQIYFSFFDTFNSNIERELVDSLYSSISKKYKK